jgi:hypothetical protein
MRTETELRAEMAMRKALGLPKITLTTEERIRAFGDRSFAKTEPYAYEKRLAERLQNGLPLTFADKKIARQFIKETIGRNL